MKLKSFSYLISLFIIVFHLPILAEEKIDIWNNKKEKTSVKEQTKEINSNIKKKIYRYPRQLNL